MSRPLISLGRLAGFSGTLLCLVSGLLRLGGWRLIGGFETLTLLQAGIACLTLGCFFLLLALVETRK